MQSQHTSEWLKLRGKITEWNNNIILFSVVYYKEKVTKYNKWSRSKRNDVRKQQRKELAKSL